MGNLSENEKKSDCGAWAMTNKTATKDTIKERIAELSVLRTLPELLTHHADRRPDTPIYKYYDNLTKDWVVLTVLGSTPLLPWA